MMAKRKGRMPNCRVPRRIRVDDTVIAPLTACSRNKQLVWYDTTILAVFNYFLKREIFVRYTIVHHHKHRCTLGESSVEGCCYMLLHREDYPRKKTGRKITTNLRMLTTIRLIKRVPRRIRVDRVIAPLTACSRTKTKRGTILLVQF
jgi:hypothetical protein